MLESQDNLTQIFPFEDIGKRMGLESYTSISNSLTGLRQDTHTPVPTRQET